MARSVDGATPRSRRLEWISVLQRLQDGSVSRPDRLRRKRTRDSQYRRRHHFQRECWSKQVSMKRSEVDYGAQSKRARNKDAETPPCPEGSWSRRHQGSAGSSTSRAENQQRDAETIRKQEGARC